MASLGVIRLGLTDECEKAQFIPMVVFVFLVENMIKSDLKKFTCLWLAGGRHAYFVAEAKGEIQRHIPGTALLATVSPATVGDGGSYTLGEPFHNF